MRITHEWLTKRRACSWQVATFDHEWPDGCEVTLATLQRAHELGLDGAWLEAHLPRLSRTEYHRVQKLALADYYRTLEVAAAEYRKAMWPAAVVAFADKEAPDAPTT